MMKQSPMSEPATDTLSPEDRVLRAARALFFSEGFAQVTTDRLAQAASVSKTTIYKYFGDMKGVLRAVVIREAQGFEAGVSADPQTAEDFREGLIRFGINLLTLLDDPQTASFEISILEQARGHPDVARAFFEGAHMRTQTALCSLVETGRQRGFIRTEIASEDLADHLVSLWKGTCHARAQLGLCAERGRDLRDWVRQGVDLVLGSSLPGR